MSDLITVLALIAAIGVVVLVTAKLFVATVDLVIDVWMHK